MATVAQRVNEMRFALRQKGVPAEVTDHLDLKAHADPKLTARENIDNFLASHGLADYNDRELRSLEAQAQDEGIEAEVSRRLAEREAALVAEIKAEGCEECNTRLRALETRLRATARGQGLKKNRRASRVVARKANPRAARAMRLASSRGISLKQAWGIVKRGGGKRRASRRSAARSAPRRRRRTMAKKGSFRRKARTAVTPKRVAKGLVVLDAARRAVAPGGVVEEVAFVVTHADQIAREGMPSAIQHGKQIIQKAAVPVLEGVGGPKLIDGAVKLASKGEPLIGRVANKKLMTI